MATPAMNQRLTRQNLRGVWAAITAPFDDNDRFDEGVFREHIRRLRAASIYATHRPYLPVSDDLVEQFRRIVPEQFQDLVWTP